MILKTRFIPGLAIYTYLIGDEETGKAAVIDCTRDVQPIIDLAKSEGLTITDICETHVHADFLSGAKELKEALGGSPTIHCSQEGGVEWTPKYADDQVQDGDEITLGTVKLRARHTPGHTPEHVVWELFDQKRSEKDPWVIYTGDFLFVGSIGRPDLLGKEAQQTLAHQLYHTTFSTLNSFPEFAEVYPGHGAGSLCGKAIGSRDTSTVGYEKKYNDSLIQKPEDKWVHDLMDQMPPAPPYFRKMKEINVKGPNILGGKLPGNHPLSPQDVLEKQKECLIVDCRSKESFAGAHIPGSLSIPLSTVLSTWAGWLLPYDIPLILILDSISQHSEVATQLIRVGFDNIVGYLQGGMETWESSGLPLECFSLIDQKHFEEVSQEKPGILVDVRSPEEWKEEHDEQAVHIPLGLLVQNIQKIPPDKQVYTICKGGYRAAIAAALLQKEGVKRVTAIVN